MFYNDNMLMALGFGWWFSAKEDDLSILRDCRTVTGSCPLEGVARTTRSSGWRSHERGQLGRGRPPGRGHPDASCRCATRTRAASGPPEFLILEPFLNP